MSPMTIPALYLHIPFCHTICPFCAFAVHGEHAALHADYLSALEAELALRAEVYAGSAGPAASVYIGGGTPSTLTLGEVQRLLKVLRRLFPLDDTAEVAFELNPEDAGVDYLAGLRALGVNRVSLGVQSVDDATLRALGRGHGAAQSRLALAAARQAGLENVNVDLLLGMPGVGAAAFRADVAWMLRERPAHVSVYALDIEPGTLFARRPALAASVEQGRDDQAARMLWAAESLTRAGYRHYEVSNYCLPGREGRQNLLVWDGANYLGFGVGAHSYVDGHRWWNVRHIRAYQRALFRGQAPVARDERPNAAQRANEELMLCLRRDSGLHPLDWARQHGQPWSAGRRRLVERLVAEGKARWNADGRLCLTEPGLLLADAITAELMV
ncbi:MAG: radical SAM family heme chaperone HemW [Candidatus Lambdaproteobacteria bacterium]|nr:radical SAM family heme chaperone HemW [Candidatus Lambdaproteobacteria bacterium]